MSAKPEAATPEAPMDAEEQRIAKLSLDQQVSELKELLHRRDAALREAKTVRQQLNVELAECQKRVTRLSQELAEKEEEIVQASAKVGTMEREHAFEEERWKKKLEEVTRELEVATKQLQGKAPASTAAAPAAEGDAELQAARERVVKLEAEIREQTTFAERERQTLLQVIESYGGSAQAQGLGRTSPISAAAARVMVGGSPRVPRGSSPAVKPEAAPGAPPPPNAAVMPPGAEGEPNWQEATYYQQQVGALQADLQEQQQQHHSEMLAVKSRFEAKIDKLTQELLGAKEKQRAAEVERDEVQTRLQTLQDEMHLMSQHHDKELGDQKARQGELQQELSNVRVALLAATDDANKPDLGLVQRLHDLEDQVEENRAAFAREKEQINSEHRIEVARMRGQLRRLMDESKAAGNKVKTLQLELQKQTEYFQEETAIVNHQLELVRAENAKIKSEARALNLQAQRDRADHARNQSRLQRELEHNVTLATETARCRIRELEAELEAIKGHGPATAPE